MCRGPRGQAPLVRTTSLITGAHSAWYVDELRCRVGSLRLAPGAHRAPRMARASHAQRTAHRGRASSGAPACLVDSEQSYHVFNAQKLKASTNAMTGIPVSSSFGHRRYVEA